MITQENQFEMFYNFCGDFDKTLKKHYLRSKIKQKGVTFPQFCISVYSSVLEETKEVLNIRPPKRRK